jgi:tetratricopeptide (TPR) repeat protein
LHKGAKGIREGDHSSATHLLSSLIKHEGLSKEARFTAYNAQGRIFKGAEKYAEAVKSYSEALTINDKEANAWTERGDCYRYLRNYNSAISDVSTAILVNPNNARALTIRGASRLSLDNWGEAKSDLVEAVRLRPRYAWALVLLGYCYRITNNRVEAMQVIQEAINASPKYKWAYLERGYLLTASKRYKEALDDCSAILAIDPAYFGALHLQADIYCILHQFNRGLEKLNAVIESAPNTHQPKLFYAEMVAHQGNYEHAIKILRDLYPKLQDVDSRKFYRSTLGLIQSYMGKYEEAVNNHEQLATDSDWGLAARYNIAVSLAQWKGLAYAEIHIEMVTQELNLRSRAGPDSVSLYGLAGLSCVKGDTEKALLLLSEAIEIELRVILWARHDIAWNTLRQNIRFQELINTSF